MRLKKGIYNVRVIKSELKETKEKKDPMIVLGCEFTNQDTEGLDAIVGKAAGSIYLVATEESRGFGLDKVHEILGSEPNLDGLDPTEYEGLELAVLAKSEDIPELDEDGVPMIDRDEEITRTVTRIDRVLRAAS